MQAKVKSSVFNPCTDTECIPKLPLDFEIDRNRKLDDLPFCSSCGELPRCQNQVLTEDYYGETFELGQIAIVRCRFCHNFLGLLENEKKFISQQEILYHMREDGWKKVETMEERRALFVLNQINHKLDEIAELEFSYRNENLVNDIVKLLWLNKHPAGFYSLKRKGTLDPLTMQCYSMPTVDTLFITKEYRRCGWATSAIKDAKQEFPNEDIGFSFPISMPMTKGMDKTQLQLNIS